MPTVREIEAALFDLAPREGTMDWDNVGHLLGNPAQEVGRCLVALDITHAVAEEAIAKGCQLIVSHHPIMNCKWSQVQTVRDDTFQGSLLTRLLRADVSAIWPWAATACATPTPESPSTGWLWAAAPAGNSRMPPSTPGAIPSSPPI